MAYTSIAVPDFCQAVAYMHVSDLFALLKHTIYFLFNLITNQRLFFRVGYISIELFDSCVVVEQLHVSDLFLPTTRQKLRGPMEICTPSKHN